MIKWMEKPYYGPGARVRHRSLRRKIDAGRYVPGVFLITEAENPSEQLEIIDNAYLQQKKIRDSLPRIVGLAYGKEEAFQIIRQIAAECMRETGGCDLAAYLKEQG